MNIVRPTGDGVSVSRALVLAPACLLWLLRATTLAGEGFTCPDGFLNFGEQCDDGNTIDGDGCCSDCTFCFPPPTTTPNTPVSSSPQTVFLSFYDSYTGPPRRFRVDVTFKEVVAAGFTSAVALANGSGTLPSNIVFVEGGGWLGGFARLFFDVSTSARAVGDITVCLYYTDGDNNGIVDGTSMHETALHVLHHEGAQFVDRTSSRDLVRNTVCATVASLSEFVLTPSIVGWVPPDEGALVCGNVVANGVGDLARSIVQCSAKAASRTGSVEGSACVPTPTDASWLNAIEAHFGVTKRATLTGSDDRDHVPRRRRVYRYLRYRNRRVGQKDHPLTRIRSTRPIKLDRH